MKEAPEPSDIIYDNSDKSFISRGVSYILSYALTGLLIFAYFFVIQAWHDAFNSIDYFYDLLQLL